MANLTSSSVNHNPLSPSHDAFEDPCCICLDPFTPHDPPTITNCKHEYHLQCILDWSQRSSECPICSQLLMLKDPVGQELLAAMASERRLKSRNLPSAASTPLGFYENFDFYHDPSLSDDSDFDDLIMQHLAAAAIRARSGHTMEPSHVASASPEEVPVQICPFSPRVQDPSLSSTNRDFPSPGSPLSSLSPLDENESSRTGISKISPRVIPTETSSGSQQKTKKSEALSFSDSIKSKWSATSIKYKESIWRRSQGIKEKLLARNSSVKELSRGAKRAGIGGVTRMIERLELSKKRNAASVSFFSCTGGGGGSSNSLKGKNVVQVQVQVQESAVTDGSVIIDRISSTGSPSQVSSTIPGSVEIQRRLRRGS